jgi:hypothetical protein
MFPVGAAGYGLLILRLCAAAMLLRQAAPRTDAALPLWGAVGLVVLAVLLCVGAFTPVGCLGSGLVQLVSLYGARDHHIIEPVVSLGVTSALFLIGPGAFSVDCRLFGRRRIVRAGR